MDINVFYGVLIPFLGTSAGAACVFFMKKNLNEQIQRALTGFAAGVMVAASISFKLRCRSDALCGSGRTHTRNVCRRTFQHRNPFLCHRILSDDDTGCSTWINR